MPTKTKAKSAFDPLVKRISLTRSEKNKFSEILGDNTVTIDLLESKLSEVRHWMRRAKNRPMAPHLVAELSKIHKAAKHLSGLLSLGRLTTEAKQCLNRLNMQAGKPLDYYKIGKCVEEVMFDADRAIDLLKAVAGNRKQTGGPRKKVIADARAQVCNELLHFFEMHASDRAKTRPKDKSAFLKICLKKISG